MRESIWLPLDQDPPMSVDHWVPVMGVAGGNSSGVRWERDDEAITAGCKILYEKIAEAFEPEWRDLVTRIYFAIDAARER